MSKADEILRELKAATWDDRSTVERVYSIVVAHSQKHGFTVPRAVQSELSALSYTTIGHALTSLIRAGRLERTKVSGKEYAYRPKGVSDAAATRGRGGR